jgi:TMEM175 potassium channel family protein
MQPRDDQPAGLPRPWGRVSTIRLETFSDSVFAIAVTLLALQLHPPNLTGAGSAGAVLHALGQQLRPFGFYTLAFLLTGRLWIEHHQLLDPLETHGRHLAATNLWFLFTVTLLPYWVNVLATYPHNNAAAGLFVLWMGVAQFVFGLVCLLVRRELGAGPAVDELVVPKVIRAANAAVLLAALGLLLIAQVQIPDAVIIAWLVLLVAGGRSAVRVWSARHRRRRAEG